MVHSSVWVFSKDTSPTQGMRLQVRNGCPAIFALFIGNTKTPSWVCWWRDTYVFTEILHRKVKNTKHKKIFFMQISHTFSLSRHLLWSRIPDVEKTSSERKGRGSTRLRERASGSCCSGKYLSQARCPERKRNIRGSQPESRTHIYDNLLSLLFNCCPWSATDQIISIQMLIES